MSYKLPYTVLKSGRGRGKSRYGFFIMGGLSLLLVASGLYVTTTWVSAGGPGALFPSDTPTPSITPTASNTPTITATATETSPPSTPTASAPFLYSVELGDTIVSIADKFSVDFIIIMLLNGLNNDSILFVGQEMIIPDPNMEIPSPTPIPEGLPRGFEIEYFVLPGDTLAGIAVLFLSTEDAIIQANELVNPDQVFVGQILLVPINLITITPGPSPTPLGTAAPSATATQ